MVQKNKIYTKAQVTQQLKKARGKENKQETKWKKAEIRKKEREKERGQTNDAAYIFKPGLFW